MLEFALKYDPELFVRGSLELLCSWTTYMAIVLGVTLLAAWATGYTRRHSALRPRDRVVLWSLRGALFAVLAFLLLDPHLRVEMDEPIRGHVTVMLDDSLSTRIADLNGSPRMTFIEREFTPGEGGTAVALEQRVDTRYLRFSNSVAALTPGERLTFTGTRSNLADALVNVAHGAGARSRAAVILVTDGIGDDPAGLDAAVRALRAAGIKLHIIGVGSERFARDLEVQSVHVPRQVLRGDTVEAEVTVGHRGMAGQSVFLTVIEESVVVLEQPLTLPADDRPATVRVPLEFMEAGARRLTFRVETQPGETVVENNAAHRVVEVRGEPVNILHIEGEPRFEVKFLRRAVADDDGIHLVSLVRTAENKYYRLGVEDSNELAGGLPESEEALFRYDAVVLGSIGAELLDTEQQERLRDFVSRRGGGLVLLGGRLAFAEGGYARSTLAGLAPVVLAEAPSAYRVRVPVRPTAAGRSDPLLRLGQGGTVPTTWEQLPPLTVVNPIRSAKPGATTILESIDETGEPLVVLAWQRYGRGTVAAFPVRDSWRWQMHAEIPVEDETHERLWRNLLRHVARPAGGRIRLHIESQEAAVGDNISVQAEILDASYRPVTTADATLEVSTPTGDLQEIRFDRSLEGEGLYRAGFVARDVGRHYLRAQLREPGGDHVISDAAVEVDGLGQEYFGAELDAGRLSQLAAVTGGLFLEANDVEQIVGAVDDTTSIRRVERRLPLGDAPLLLGLLITLACFEWFWRRRRGLA